MIVNLVSVYSTVKVKGCFIMYVMVQVRPWFEFYFLSFVGINKGNVI